MQNAKKRLKIVFYFRNTISFIEPAGNYTYTNFNFRGWKNINCQVVTPCILYLFLCDSFSEILYDAEKINQTQFWVYYSPK